MKNPVIIILVIIILGLLGWIIYQNSGPSASHSVAAGAFNATGSTVSAIEGTDVKTIESKDANGVLTERGQILNDLKTGTWTSYFSDQRVKTIANYAAGKLNGIYLELNERGQVELQTSYKDDALNGKYAKYKQGSRKLEEREYLMGILHGVVKKYDDRRSKLQQEIHYKNGEQDGPFRYYDEEGNITLEYIYKNGEKVSGGIVEKKPVTATE
ncbi:MAG: antitoxin component YwqK of YwqJK toxin-antitoxin module [Saprospiraceae bacterium]|jgi:antitoxin component YwqK of YwqJK toxin-antitoxin module